MRLAFIVLLAAALLAGCVQESGGNTAMNGTSDNVSGAMETGGGQPEAPAQPQGQGEVAQPPPAAQGDVLIIASIDEIELSTLVSEVRVPNPDCYPDAQKCAMIDEPINIMQEKVDRFYNVSSSGDPCLLAPESAGENEKLYLVGYSFENQDSASHSIEPSMLRIGTDQENQYLVTSPRSGSNCVSFVDDSTMTLGPGETSGKLKAIVTIPDSETPLTASYLVDGGLEKSAELG